MHHKMHGKFSKKIDRISVEAFYDGYPMSVTVGVEFGNEIHIHGVEQVRDLIYALQCLERDYTDVPGATA